METVKTKYKKRKTLLDRRLQTDVAVLSNSSDDDRPQQVQRTRQITYPAPYSQSWNPDVAPVLMKNSVGRANSLFQGSKRSTGRRPWSNTYSTTGRPDPTAPHLKYGVFRNRRGLPVPSVSPVKVPSAKPRRKPQNQQVIKIPVEQFNKQLLVPARKKIIRKPKFPPVFVFRNVDKSYSKNLSYSKITHMDIKPRRIPSLSPSYCPSPNFKALPRRFSVSPTKLMFIKDVGTE